MEKIDWEYWLKRKSLFEIEVALLTLGIDPENHQIDYLGDHYLVDMNALKSMQKDYIRRMTFIQENRFTPYEYMANDGESGNFYFDTEGRVRVKRFLLWLKNEDMGWTLPKELQAYIEKLNNNPKALEVKANSPEVIKGENILNRVQSKQEQQDTAILSRIKLLGHDPLSLPKEKSGKRTIKADIRNYFLGNSQMFTYHAFDNAWKRLKEEGKIN
ncbi:hypothetical protein G6717_05495 [Polynucleobacter paneuropaeus]|nr:hypothetical protein [Polynucleobacter paneuropaeus]